MSRKTKRQTLYMPPQVHDQMRELAYVERTTQQDLMREAMDMMFKARGKKTWKELVETEN